MRNVLITIGLSSLFVLTSCGPAAAPIPVTPRPSPSPALTGAPSIMPQSVPTALPGPGKTLEAAASGLHVTAATGPTCPGPQRPGQVCAQPYEGAFVVKDSRGIEVANFTTDQTGQATVDLPPGAYTVTPKLEGRFPSGEPITATVVSGQYAEVNIELDTGIR